ncbi:MULTISPECIES: LytTR family DNA-binding domain-containing protein [unclassified Aureispira]|uniref:LytR/AlgR family response regulator transcription factor n=1 Tax=unclassified Aureispira TaxID=2649989 RepID=UPI00069663B6|nr:MULTISPECIES: response regulator transcription factor [unclassified Aureispira]WMX12028.1 response regulator transcription factor [Aureispira sp. CCB-E]
MASRIRSIIVDDEPTARDILNIHLAKIPTIDVVAICKNALEAFEAINTKEVDLIFLDINMPGISGLSFAKTISKDKKIVFTTAYREFALEGFELKAVDYLLKPISFERLLQSIESYVEVSPFVPMSKMEIEPIHRTFIFVRSDRKMVKVVFSEILYIESFGDYLKIHLNNKLITTRQTLSSIEIQLPAKHFIRIHRSFIVNMYAIHSFSNEAIEVNGVFLPISRGYKKETLIRLEATIN